MQDSGCRLQDGRAHTHFICPKPTFCLAGHICAVQVAHLLSRDSASLPGYLQCACGAFSGIYGAPTARRACGADFFDSWNAGKVLKNTGYFQHAIPFKTPGTVGQC